MKRVVRIELVAADNYVHCRPDLRDLLECRMLLGEFISISRLEQICSTNIAQLMLLLMAISHPGHGQYIHNTAEIHGRAHDHLRSVNEIYSVPGKMTSIASALM
ncbi:hypothetical protein Mapa_017057 [Marchantia paleacea]|nr:hypothetical protein Mapa_017057 [Marchantia paleacea]